MRKITSYVGKHISLKTKFRLRVLLSKISNVLDKQRIEIFNIQEEKGIETIPIFVISYNRLSYLKVMIERLERLGKTNIIIIDNASTYPPLLEYYKQIPYKVIKMEQNEGHMVFWNNPKFEDYRKNFYIVSDPDIEIIDECPQDFIKIFFEYLKKYPFVRKVGFSLKIDDLPEQSILGKEVQKWERRYYKAKVDGGKLFYAAIDTTFALYVPDQLAKKLKFYSAFRTAYPYQARHLPWYKLKTNITDEDIFYSQNKKNGWWDNANGTVTPDNEKEYANEK